LPIRPKDVILFAVPAKALYQKYRPQSFDDVQGQDHITNTLRNALVLNRIAHAYLFTGTRGTGKTSTARILAKAVNCLDPDPRKRPCNQCAICQAINQERLLDLVEIDAASNTGVDNIRDLRDKIDFRPNEARFKVYIIDEVHMLSTSAFNALLKTLEEPPPYVIFILATTEVNRVPATISSRCQRFDFKRASLQELMQQLDSIAGKEDMQLEPAALELVARQANGSFRDGTSLLDQLTAYSGDTITLKHVQVLLGAASREIIHEIAAAIAARDIGRGIAALDAAVDAGADPRQIARDVVEYLRGILMFVVKSDATLNVGDEVRAQLRDLAAQMNAEQCARAIRLFSQSVLDLRNSASPTLPLEMALVEATLDPAPVVAAATQVANARAASSAASANPFAATPNPKPKAETTYQRVSAPKRAKASEEVPAQAPEISGALSVPGLKKNWDNLIRVFQMTNKAMAPFLKDAEPLSLKDNVLVIGFFYEYHQSRFDNDKQAQVQFAKVLQDAFGAPIHIKCIVSPKREKMREAQNDPLVRTGMNLGGKVTNIIEDSETAEEADA
jgi:DNA polymerase-3 subunit gamma/tau